LSSFSLLCAHLTLHAQVKYRKIWEKVSGSEANGLYVWRPISPSPEFVAIGVICTKTNDEPPLEACRCVNRGWLANITQKVRQRLHRCLAV
jgi:hypothetical protein